MTGECLSFCQSARPIFLRRLSGPGLTGVYSRPREGAVRGVVHRVVVVVRRVPHHHHGAAFYPGKAFALDLADHDDRGAEFAFRAGQFEGDGDPFADLPPDAADGATALISDHHAAVQTVAA